jgi:hypothetical protein
MKHKALIKRLETTCFGLDPIDPLRLLVDDVVAALAQPQRTWVGMTDEEIEQALARANYAVKANAVAWRHGVEWAQFNLMLKNT